MTRAQPNIVGLRPALPKGPASPFAAYVKIRGTRYWRIAYSARPIGRAFPTGQGLDQPSLACVGIVEAAQFDSAARTPCRVAVSTQADSRRGRTRPPSSRGEDHHRVTP